MDWSGAVGFALSAPGGLSSNVQCRCSNHLPCECYQITRSHKDVSLAQAGTGRALHRPIYRLRRCSGPSQAWLAIEVVDRKL